MDIRTKREKLGLTQEALAEASGVSRLTIQRYESGTRTPNIIIAARIAKALGCKVDDIITR